jgi:soluble lytic murein transglycosylase-like protein
MGQQYLMYLSQKDLAGDDLLHVLASYNSGPGAVQHWRNLSGDDPMMYIETIPCDETRRFVQHTLMNLWLYAARFRTPAPSLDALASGQWPRFAPEIRAQARTLH